VTRLHVEFSATAARTREDGEAEDWVVLVGLQHLAGPDHRMFDRLLSWPAGPTVTASGPVRVASMFSVPHDAEAELASWYSEEHVPMLHAVPGWRRTTRYRLRSGIGPVFLALHELDGIEPFDHPAYLAAVSTPWGGRIQALATARERWVLRADKALTAGRAGGD
jgi:hypothetical protein